MRTNLLDVDDSSSPSSFGLSHRTYDLDRPDIGDDGMSFRKAFSKGTTSITYRSRTCILLLLILFIILTIVLIIGYLLRNGSTKADIVPNPAISSSSSTGTSIITASSSTGSTGVDPYDLGQSITVDQLYVHLNALQSIADNNGGSRVVGSTGFNATVDYVVNVLKTQTNFPILQQYFPILDWFLGSPPMMLTSSRSSIANYTYPADYAPFSYSGSGDLTATEVVVIRNYGCFVNDYANLTVIGRIVIVLRGTCTVTAKTTLAQNAYASAILVYNDGTVGNKGVFLSRVATNTRIPTVSLSYDVGIGIVQAVNSAIPGSFTMRLFIDGRVQPITVVNTCVTTLTGNVSNTIVVGSHYDSVQAGPGVNDNGSGTSLNLALAITASRILSVDPSIHSPYLNRIRFCWWAAEELGLLGSAEYVRRGVIQGNLGINGTMGERIPQDIQINLNYDIVGSPNFVFGVWDGNTFGNRSNPLVTRSVVGSLTTTRLYEEFMNKTGLTYDYRELDNRSDYASFHAAGVAAGGATSGRETLKTIEQRNRYARILGAGKGGIPDVAYDPCYHQPCDQVYGVNPQAILNITRAAAAVLVKLANIVDLPSFLGYNSTKSISTADGHNQQNINMELLENNLAENVEAMMI